MGTTADGRVTYTHEAGWHVLRYFGRVDYTMAPAIEQFLDRLGHGPPTSGAPSRFVFELSGARILDSTNLGLIARVVDRARDTGAAPSVIVVGSGDLDDVVRSMGFEAIVELRPDSPLAAVPVDQLVVATSDTAPRAEMFLTMLEAHRSLAELDDGDGKQWHEVVALLEAELRR
jgi:anti-anti-sigma regulatory factor